MHLKARKVDLDMKGFSREICLRVQENINLDRANMFILVNLPKDNHRVSFE